MSRTRRPRRNFASKVEEVDEDGNVLWHGVKLGEFCKTDMQVAINESNRREDISFSIRMGRAGTTHPYQQPIPVDFVRHHGKPLYQKSLTLEGPTGRIWTVILRPSVQSARFGRGWRQFAEENHLQEGYQLLFTLVPKFHFLVQFFDHLGKRCTIYPPLPGFQLVVAETWRQPGSQSGFIQPVVDGKQASHRHGSEAQTSTAGLLLGSTSIAAIPRRSDSDQDNVILREFKTEVPDSEAGLPNEHVRVPTFDPSDKAEETETEDEATEALAEDKKFILVDSDNDDLLFHHLPPTKPFLEKTEPPQLAVSEILLRKRAKPTHVQHSNSSSSDDEPSDMELKKAKKADTRKKVPVKRVSRARDSSPSSPAVCLLQRQGCIRFSDIVSKCRRRDVSNRERVDVQAAAKQFASRLGNETFSVVMREAQVYRGFHLEIPGSILKATGTTRASKAEVCLFDQEQAQYKAHWIRQNFFDPPLVDRDAWAKFAVDHALEEGDVCVFQLLPQLSQSKPVVVSEVSLHFFVFIFRIVETLDVSDATDDDSDSEDSGPKTRRRSRRRK